MHSNCPADRELASFSYRVSHDVSASFRQVAGFSRLLLSDAENLTDRQLMQLEFLRRAADNCQSMMEQLLAYSRAQQHTLQQIQLAATAVAQRSLMGLADQVRAAGVDVRVEPLGEVVADPELLALAFDHLFDNAIKFRRAGAPHAIRISPAHTDEQWRVRITDGGIGVAPAYREKAFAMFQRLNGEGDYAGVGAGLAICRRIARRHGGDVEFVDCADGACVELSLPRAGVTPRTITLEPACCVR